MPCRLGIWIFENTDLLTDRHGYQVPDIRLQDTEGQFMKKKTRDKFQSEKAPTEITHSEFDLDEEVCPKIESLFLVISYAKKYDKVEKAIKNFFGDIYKVYIGRDCMGGLLEGICERIKEVDFGIVVLAGLKKCRKVGKRKKYYVKFNIPFEYGMFQILDLPVMILCEKNLNLDIKTEFSDISNIQRGEKFEHNWRPKKIEKHIAEKFKKFIPELAKKSVNRAFDRVEKLKQLPYSETKTVKTSLKTIYETQIKTKFEDKMISTGG
jgi:hypothetical protein